MNTPQNETASPSESRKEISKYIERLYTEWKQHGKIIIAVDYDDTISPWRMHREEDILALRIVEDLKMAKHAGAFIVCFTACNEDRYDEIKNRFKFLGIELDTINHNPVDLPYGNQNKIYANLFLDDRAGLNEALEILEAAMYRIIGEKNSSEMLIQDF